MFVATVDYLDTLENRQLLALTFSGLLLISLINATEYALIAQSNGKMTYQPFFSLGSNRTSPFVITCDHATNTVPEAISNGELGLSHADMNRHIAYDIGAFGVAQHLGVLLNAPVVASNFSRLVIDPNRGEQDPTLLMKLYDGTIIAGNRNADHAEIERRLQMCYRPYHNEVARLMSTRSGPVLISIHSFTKQLNGRAPRPWHIGILSAHDRRLSDPFLDILRTNSDWCVGDNEPYIGDLPQDSVDKHALQHGHLNTLIEIRNDLIETEEQQETWAKALAPMLDAALERTRAA
jgi:predicted N-formylglutamate amidohydrolase